jgi:hypothetical protein
MFPFWIDGSALPQLQILFFEALAVVVGFYTCWR